MIRYLALALPLCLAVPLPGLAQDQTLADIRQELTVLTVEIRKLNRELSTTGSPGATVGGSMLDRVNQIEAELQRLTGKTEALEIRINRIVADGTNRLGDLEFRLCELEAGCDIASLGRTPALGGGDPGPAQPVAAPAETGVAMAVGEQADFDQALQQYNDGAYADAAERFQTFSDTYTGGPLTGQAHFWRGEALGQLGQTAPSARAYLESFSGWPNGPKAPDALFGLGRALGQLNQTTEACTTLAQVGVRYPGSAANARAETERQTLGCS